MRYTGNFKGRSYSFADLKTLLAKASPLRSADILAGIAAASEEERAVAQWLLADLPLTAFLAEPLIPPEEDEVSRLIAESHDPSAFAPISSLTVGELREWLLTDAVSDAEIAGVRQGLTPEMAAAAAKIMRNQDLIAVAKRCAVTTRFRNTIGLPGRLSTRLQPNHPTDDPRGIAASVLDGLLYGSGDAVIGINPATDSPKNVAGLLHLLDDIIRTHEIPTQSCVLAHVTVTLDLMRRGAPVDLVFQSIAGTEAANRSFGINLALLAEARETALPSVAGRWGTT